MSKACDACGATFSPARKTSRYCSRRCLWSRNGKNQKRTGSRWRNAKGYIELAVWRDGKRVHVKEHRQIMEDHLGRQLAADEDVHHKNGIKDDNRIENLEVLSHGAHSAETDKVRPRKKGYKMNLTPEQRQARRDRMIKMREHGPLRPSRASLERSHASEMAELLREYRDGLHFVDGVEQPPVPIGPETRREALEQRIALAKDFGDRVERLLARIDGET